MKEVLAIPGNSVSLGQLRRALQTPLGIVPFVGAGVSIPFGMPSWTRFLLDKGADYGIQQKIQNRLSKHQYEEAAEDLEVAMTPFNLRLAIRDAYGQPLHLQTLAPTDTVPLLLRLARGPMVTTNFDQLLETAATQLKRTFAVVVEGADPYRIANMLAGAQDGLVKLHGSWDTGQARVLTRREYDAAYGSPLNPQLPLPHLLQNILVGRSLLFVGCSLHQDRTMTVQVQVAQHAPGMTHFAIIEDPPSATERRKRLIFLGQRNIAPIWYPHGQHAYVQVVLDDLVRNIPPQYLRQFPLAPPDPIATVGNYTESFRRATAELLLVLSVIQQKIQNGTIDDEEGIQTQEKMRKAVGQVGEAYLRLRMEIGDHAEHAKLASKADRLRDVLNDLFETKQGNLDDIRVVYEDFARAVPRLQAQGRTL